MKALLIILLLPLSALAQLSRSSRVILHVDKSICYPGDTIRFSSYSYRNKETNLYVDVYSDDSILVSRNIFPILNNKATGSIIMPGQSGYYWLRGYTYNSQVYILPMAVLNDSIKVFSSRKVTPSNTSLPLSPHVTITPENDSLSISVEDALSSSLSVSVTDVRLPAPAYTFLPSATDFSFPETEYLTYRGTVKMNSRNPKSVRDKELIFLFKQDSATKIVTVPVDTTGTFKISGLFFNDTASLNYQLDGQNGRNADVTISFQQKEYPQLNIPAFVTDTVYFVPETVAPVFSDKVGYLKAVVVKTAWSDRHKGLERKYIQNARFSWPAQFHYDLRNPDETKYTYHIKDYLRRTLPFFEWDFDDTALPRFKGRMVRFYIDEQEIQPRVVAVAESLNFAYVKVIEDLDVDSKGDPIAMIVIYTRKGEDWKPVPGKLNAIRIEGYSTPVPFVKPDRITALWMPDQKGNRFRIKKCIGRLVIQGLSSKGDAIRYETMLK